MNVNSATRPRLYPSSVNESPQRLIKFMLLVGAMEFAAISEQSPGFLVQFDKFLMPLIVSLSQESFAYGLEHFGLFDRNN